jgi:hypothetical protein
MSDAAIAVGVVGALVQPVTAWGAPKWYPRAVLEAPPALPAGTALGGDLRYLGPAEIALHRVETARYRDNLATGRPRLWVVLDAPSDEHGLPGVVVVTADGAEGEHFTEAGIDLADRTVETVPMPAAIASAVAAFVDAHHVERSFVKRKRDRADPDALGRRGVIGEEE